MSEDCISSYCGVTDEVGHSYVFVRQVDLLLCEHPIYNLLPVSFWRSFCYWFIGGIFFSFFIGGLFYIKNIEPGTVMCMVTTLVSMFLI